MKPVAKMTVGELAAYICTHLREENINVVLSGGACVSIYSDGRYVSKDLDFIETRFATAGHIRDAMAGIGFTPEDRHFTHADTDYFVEFPSGPLSVGRERARSIEEIEFSTGVLRILSPTDCVKDRLTAYFHWNDLQCLEQAVLVAQSCEVDVREVKRWSRDEGMADAFNAIATRLE